jgi:hypothetical protein
VIAGINDTEAGAVLTLVIPLALLLIVLAWWVIVVRRRRAAAERADA